MRGLLTAVHDRVRHMRYNPAYAGTTDVANLARTDEEIQPRVCGDYARASADNGLYCDTTPRMRGLLLEQELARFQSRYNPAYAGTTHTREVFCMSDVIQPRVCGDYFDNQSPVGEGQDTTPRMRGLP